MTRLCWAKGSVGSRRSGPLPLRVMRALPAIPDSSWRLARPLGVSVRSLYRKPELVCRQQARVRQSSAAGALTPSRRLGVLAVSS